mmetsp:Transcript_16666/g.29898  ORF Transcript_16666/g.29898 Transcript_16666/m.29898 type:complete len:171 (-) Transcript_16666:153-665(-)|eukprot:CAMPEP_0197534100 /NCGR_PEP_ID=MMETSP1318-20131121/45926_1 /TAXON_ID=552666 /ORGANISM="Partenskyella glossopodia, Strain RCC365" /LENGTH=170 /DNA_ID=CAMNT_0043091233 /DNA_START=45 /DNA_END=557 /DNA_ORIENTATION=-
MLDAVFAKADMPFKPKYKWKVGYSPHTDPSFELEAFSHFNNSWITVLSGGIIQQDVIRLSGRDPQTTAGWSIRLGLDRVASMCLGLPDSRLLLARRRWDKGLSAVEPWWNTTGSHKGHNLGSEQMDFDFATSNILDSAVAPSLKDAITEALYDSFTSQSDSESQISKAYH